MMNRTRLKAPLVVLCIVLLMLILVGCGSGPSSTTSSTTDSATSYTPCPGGASVPVLQYQPEFLPLTIGYNPASGEFSVDYTPQVVTPVGTFSASENVYESCNPDDNTLIIVISYNLHDYTYAVGTSVKSVHASAFGSGLVSVTAEPHKIYVFVYGKFIGKVSVRSA